MDDEKVLQETIETLQADNSRLEESISEIRMQLSVEDKGWQLIEGLASGDRVEGLDLDEVKELSARNRVRIAAASLTKRASDLHVGHVFGRGLSIEGTSRTKGSRGAKTNLLKFYEKGVNQESVFGESARAELQRARFTDGNVLVACDTRRQETYRIPMSQVTSVITDPKNPENIILYKRTWTKYPETAGGQPEEASAWYYTNRFTGTRQAAIGSGPDRVAVAKDTTVVDLRANRQVGWVFGIPDALAGLHWAEAYAEHVKYGMVVTQGLSKLIFKITNKSKKGAEQAGVKMASSRVVGGTASMAENQDVEAVRTAGSAYSFEKLRPIAAMAASAWNVSNMDLLNDSSAAGSSYGSAQSLVPGNRNYYTGVQKEWTRFFQDVFAVMGFDRPAVHWEPLEAPDAYRAAQALTLLAPTLHDEEYRSSALDILDLPGSSSDIPDILKARLQDATVTPDAAATQSTPGQGQSNGTGSGGSGAQDTRTDNTIGETLRAMQTSDFLDRFEGLVSRMEAAQS